MADQTEKGFQKQPTIFVGAKKYIAKKSKLGRYWKNIGLGFKTPREAIEGEYIDKKCPFAGDVRIRGRILRGVVRSHKMKNTVILRRDYLHYNKKYGRYEKRHRNLAAHMSPCFRVGDGDQVIVGECRPLSKTVRFNVLKVVSHHEDQVLKAFKAF